MVGRCPGPGRRAAVGGTTLVIRGAGSPSASPELTLLYPAGGVRRALGLASSLTGEVLPRRLSGLAGGLLAFQIVVVTAFSYLLWFWLMRHYPATTLSSFTLLTPLFGLLAGVVLLGEPLTARLATACGSGGPGDRGGQPATPDRRRAALAACPLGARQPPAQCPLRPAGPAGVSRTRRGASRLETLDCPTTRPPGTRTTT